MPVSVERGLRVERKALPRGEAAFDFTANEMAKAAMGPYGAGSPRLRLAVLKAIAAEGIDSKDIDAEIDVCHRLVRDSIRYVYDPRGIEWITYPETLFFEIRQGDCDDHCVLLAAMLGCIGIASRFVVVQTPGHRTYNHVYLLAKGKKRWIPCDPIMKKRPTGWKVPNAQRTKIYPINSADGIGYLSIGAIIGMLAGIWRVLQGLGFAR